MGAVREMSDLPPHNPSHLIIDMGALAGLFGYFWGLMPGVVLFLAAIYYCISIANGVRQLFRRK